MEDTSASFRTPVAKSTDVARLMCPSILEKVLKSKLARGTSAQDLSPPVPNVVFRQTSFSIPIHHHGDIAPFAFPAAPPAQPPPNLWQQHTQLYLRRSPNPPKLRQARRTPHPLQRSRQSQCSQAGHRRLHVHPGHTQRLHRVRPAPRRSPFLTYLTPLSTIQLQKRHAPLFPLLHLRPRL